MGFKQTLNMEIEVQVAVQFVASFINDKCTKTELEQFVKYLTKGLSAKFEGHWYPEKPSKGSAYRCVSIENQIDAVLLNAAMEANFDSSVLTDSFPKKLDLWIDPSEVSYRIGEHGAVIVIYKEGDDCVNSTSEYLAKVLDKLPTVIQKQPIVGNQHNGINKVYPIRNSPLINTQPLVNSYIANGNRQFEKSLSPTAKTFVSRNSTQKNLFSANRTFNPAGVNPILNLEYLQKLQWPLLLASGYDPLAAQLVQNYLIMQELQKFETRRLALQSHYLKLQSMQFSKKHNHLNNRQQNVSPSVNTNRLQVTA
ncbi:BTG family protein [Hydra vulgaris]|uniref:BTG family protein n=1 Tax=Hydra vulgaris TaxID=6087 RepID=A0ABM4CCF9_HYDVU